LISNLFLRIGLIDFKQKSDRHISTFRLKKSHSTVDSIIFTEARRALLITYYLLLITRECPNQLLYDYNTPRQSVALKALMDLL
jgi:hypothetical protein